MLSNGASEDTPLLFVARLTRGVSSWAVPFVTAEGYVARLEIMKKINVIEIYFSVVSSLKLVQIYLHHIDFLSLFLCRV